MFLGELSKVYPASHPKSAKVDSSWSNAQMNHSVSQNPSHFYNVVDLFSENAPLPSVPIKTGRESSAK